MEIITKTAFADRCGVSNTTAFKWIKNNKDGIRDYVTPDGIKDSIFTVAPWNQMDTRPKTQSKNAVLRGNLETAKQDAENIQAELNEVRNLLNEANHKNELLTQEIEHLKETIADREKWLAEKDGHISQLYGMLHQQLYLPAVKKPLLQRVVEFFKGSQPEQ